MIGIVTRHARITRIAQTDQPGQTFGQPVPYGTLGRASAEAADGTTTILRSEATVGHIIGGTVVIT